MKRDICIALVCLCFLSFSSICLSIDIKQKMNLAGDAQIEMTYDISTVKEAGGYPYLFGNVSRLCEGFYSRTLWKNPYCAVDGNKAVMRGIVSFKDSPDYVVRRSVPYNTYVYDAKGIYWIFSAIGGDENITDKGLNGSASEALLTRVKVNYVLEMPGEIVQSGAGAISANRVSMDAQELAGREHAYVESRELNVSWIIGLVSFIPIMLFVSYVAGRKQKKRGY